MCSKGALLLLFASVVSCDRNLPVLFQFSQPSHNVAVYRGADLLKAQAAGLFGGLKTSSGKSSGDDNDSSASSYATTTPAPPPPPPTYAPSTTPAPPPVVYTPKPIVYKPAPIVYKPAPKVVYKPAPKVVYKPAPKVVYKPAPKVVYKPAPLPVVTYKPAPVVKYAPAPAPSYKEPVYADADAVYDWEYAVKDDYTSNDFGHKESRAGAHTDGKYYVALPDGRLQTVTYTVDGYAGYVPVVEYTGEPSYPVAKPQYEA